jgi:hypothetical protein
MTTVANASYPIPVSIDFLHDLLSAIKLTKRCRRQCSARKGEEINAFGIDERQSGIHTVDRLPARGSHKSETFLAFAGCGSMTKWRLMPYF